jgi:hypothetical protein
MNWSQFDENFENLEEVKPDYSEGAENAFLEIPEGNYEVRAEEIMPTISKSEKPMLSIRFRILAGEFENQIIFYNQVISPENKGFLQRVVNLLQSLVQKIPGFEVKYQNMSQFENLIMDVSEKVEGKTEYLLEYSNEPNSKKDFKRYKILEVYEKSGSTESTTNNDDLPF